MRGDAFRLSLFFSLAASQVQVPVTSADPPGIPNKLEVSYAPVGFLTNPGTGPLPQEDCITEEGEQGVCLSAYDCGLTNGLANGPCHQGLDSAASPRTCCVYPSYCGYETNLEITYFKNPNYPAAINNTPLCHFRVNLLPDVCQVRVDFVDFSLKPMETGTCSPNNSMTISSRNREAFIPLPSVCGRVSRDEKNPARTDMSHVYVHVEQGPLDAPLVELPNTPPPSVDFKVYVTNFTSRWNVRIAQVSCDGAPLQAPAGCSQYYNAAAGNISSFNYADKSFQTGLDLDHCIRLDTAACALRYRIHQMSVGNLKNKSPVPRNQFGFGLTCQDYIAFNGVKSGICGRVISPRDIILPTDGPQGFFFHSDGAVNSEPDAGFRMEYRYLYNCSNLEYFKFPTNIQPSL